jgi:hypothetical protein
LHQFAAHGRGRFVPSARQFLSLRLKPNEAHLQSSRRAVGCST